MQPPTTLPVASIELEVLADTLSVLMQARQTVLPKRLIEPGPDFVALNNWLASATSAPDHGQLRPWRLIYIPTAERMRLGHAFADALIERDAMATQEQIEQARDKAMRSPILLIVVVNAQVGDMSIDMNERVLSAGCAVQNLLLMATAQGWGTALTSGKAMKSKAVKELLLLEVHEHAICCLSVGSVAEHKAKKNRPNVCDVVQTLTAHGVTNGLVDTHEFN